MLLNRLNQLELDSSDTILDEQFVRPNVEHMNTPMAMEKEGKLCCWICIIKKHWTIKHTIL